MNYRPDQSEIILSAANLRHNLKLVQGLVTRPGCQVLPVLKSNAYGHGLEECFSILRSDPAPSVYAVNSLFEARQLLDWAGEAPGFRVLIMGTTARRHEKLLSGLPVIQVTSDPDQVRRLRNLPRPPEVHLKMDTGMRRLGLDPSQIEKGLNNWTPDNLPIQGLMTHFADIEDVTDFWFGRRQLSLFQEAIDGFRSRGFDELTCHSAASAAGLILPDSHQDWVRLGISLYGVWPSRETRISGANLYSDLPELKPVLTLKSRVVHTKEFSAGDTVGYGRTWTAPGPGRLAVVPLGYQEGIPRILSNRGRFLVAGKPAAILGRVCMNMTMVDISHIPEARVGSEVILIGRDEKTGAEVSADEWAGHAQTINYEIFTNLDPGLPRRITED